MFALGSILQPFQSIIFESLDGSKNVHPFDQMTMWKCVIKMHYFRCWQKKHTSSYWKLALFSCCFCWHNMCLIALAVKSFEQLVLNVWEVKGVPNCGLIIRWSQQVSNRSKCNELHTCSLHLCNRRAVSSEKCLLCPRSSFLTVTAVMTGVHI